MITPPTSSFFAIRITGEAADIVTNKLSPSTTADIFEAVLISDDFESDIFAYNEMDLAIGKIKAELNQEDITIETKLNPLYYPATREDIENSLEANSNDESFKFTGMEGNPFTMASTNIRRHDELVITASMACHQFELPSLTDILDAQKQERLQ